MAVEITGLYTALAALLLLFLAYRVVGFRRGQAIGMGDGGNDGLALAIRTHGNAVEYIPITLLLMLVAELNGLGGLWLHLAGLGLLACRASHAWGFTQSGGKYSPFRFFGIAGNWLVILLLSVANIVLFVI